MNFSARLAVVRAGRATVDDFGDLARHALDEGEEEAALPWVASAATQYGMARLWQWTGLLHRALDAHQAAFDAFGEATRLAPADVGIAHGRARVALEAGLDAVALFETAERLGPPNGDILIGLAAARWAAGRGEEAEAALDAIIAQVPLWIQGHNQLAQLRALMGKPKLILMDDPSMGLSPLLVKEIFAIIREVNKQGITILLVEQNAKMALAISDRAYVLETGTITLSGDAQELLNDARVKKAYLGQ